MSIPSEDVLINALNHKIRREILEIVKLNPTSYTSLLEQFDISNGKLNYHLKLLSGFLSKDEDGIYNITALGQKTLQILADFRSQVGSEEQPLIKKAYLSQKEQEKSFIELQYVGGYRLKMVLLVAIYVMMTVSMFQIVHINPVFVMTYYIVVTVVIFTGLLFLYKVQKSSKTFSRRMDRLLGDMDK
ncbi:MAG: helix-turn-helix transcriptional regulator [archaeon]|nr:helix-turn-helix transcriptional regulator [archaeon]